MRIVLLHTRLSGYLAACLREFKRRSGAELLIYCWPHQPDAPFDPDVFADLGEIRNRREHADAKIEAAVRAYQPDAILTSGWVDKGYVKICKAMREKGVPVIAGCDTQWTGSLRQQVAGMTARFHVRKAIDVLWVTGERQATLAGALGYHGAQLWDGYYACDWERFAMVRTPDAGAGHQNEAEDPNPIPDSRPLRPGLRASSPGSFFLFVGRYAPEKGLDTLAEAYRIYCGKVERPWKLVCAGSGPLRDTLLAAGAEDRGFVQPVDLPALLQSASAFILPSRFEPWGVVVQEAAASGLPMVLSDACGAGVHLLRNFFNGYLFPSGDAAGLTRAMLRIHHMNAESRLEFGRRSFKLSEQYSPGIWALRLQEGLKQFSQGL